MNCSRVIIPLAAGSNPSGNTVEASYSALAKIVPARSASRKFATSSRTEVPMPLTPRFALERFASCRSASSRSAPQRHAPLRSARSGSGRTNNCLPSAAFTTSCINYKIGIRSLPRRRALGRTAPSRSDLMFFTGLSDRRYAPTFRVRKHVLDVPRALSNIEVRRPLRSKPALRCVHEMLRRGAIQTPKVPQALLYIQPSIPGRLSDALAIRHLGLCF